MKQNKRLIAITGGIGSGKSFVAKLAAKEFGLQYIDTDSLAKRQMMPGGCSYKGVVDYFGEDILKESGEIDPSKLGPKVFGHPEELKMLNSLTHPNVIAEVKSLADEYEGDTLVESALLVEAGMTEMFDEIIVVQAPDATRLDRLMKERGYERERAISVLASQRSKENYAEIATLVIDNPDGCTVDELRGNLQKLFVEKN